ncbi:hypothetical protein DFS34DRAFT_42050 [Phlyctochytrium arcticum]|nr:hypothetical protein DFS34DRAFT_42050 [Phlyctochytrium arcticum]
MSCQAAIQPKPSTSTAVEIVDLDHYEPTIAIDNDTSTSVTGQNGAVPPLQLNLPLPATGRVGRSSPDTATAPDIDNGGLTFVNGYNPNREKKRRQIINRQQLEVLHAEFLKNNLPEKNARLALANKLNIPERQIAIWFQNKRKSVRERGLEAAFAVRTPAPPNPSRSQIPQNVSRSNPVRRQSQKENRQPSPAPPRQSHVHTAPAPLPNPSMPTTASIASTLADPSNSLLTSILTAYFKASMTTSAARLQAGPRPPLADISQQFAMSGSRTPIRRPQSQDVIDVTSPEQPPRPSLPEAPIILDSPPQQNNNLRSSRYITRSILSTPPRRHTSSHRTALHRTSPIQRRADVSPSFSDIFSPSDLDNPAFAGALRQTDFLSASSPPRRSTHRQRDTRQPQSSIGISRPLDRPSKTSLKRTRSPENVIVIDEDLLNSPTRKSTSGLGNCRFDVFPRPPGGHPLQSPIPAIGRA